MRRTSLVVLTIAGAFACADKSEIDGVAHVTDDGGSADSGGVSDAGAAAPVRETTTANVVGDASVIVVNQGSAAKVVRPVAPAAGQFFWPSLQSDFVSVSSGATCKGRVALAVSDHAVCYTAADDKLKCAGRTYLTVYGPSFVDAGQIAVDQVYLSGSVNGESGNSVCVHRTDKKVVCFGANVQGEVDASQQPIASWALWGGGRDYERIAARWDVCALDAAGAISCSKSAAPAGSGHHRIWFDNSGTVRSDDANLLRVSGRCVLTTTGPDCTTMQPSMSGPVTWPIGGIVDVGFTRAGDLTPDRHQECVLEENGRVTCAEVVEGPPGMSSVVYRRGFAAAGAIVALAFDETNACAVSEVGALWCYGWNFHGQLGTGTAFAVPVETQVQPPGSVHIGCP